MAFPAPLSPLGDAAGDGVDPLPGLDAGQLGDFFHLPAGDASSLLPSANLPSPPAPAPLPAPDSLLAAALAQFTQAEAPAVSPDTASRLQELASALLASPSPPQASPGAVSLTALADQLSARFLNPEAPPEGFADLLASPAPSPASAPPPAPTALRAALDALPPAPAAAIYHAEALFIEETVAFSPAWQDENDSPALDFLAPAPLAPLPAPPAAFRPAAAPLAAAAPAPPSAAPALNGTGLLLGGAGLIVLGIALACRLPLLWLDLEAADPWARQALEAGMILQAAGALSALTLGTGSLLLRRWAPPLIHAIGWIAVFAALLLLGVTGVVLGSESETLLSPADGLGLAAALLLPLAYLFYYERESVAATCAAASPEPAWTDRQSVPALMVLLCHVILALAAAAMLRYPAAFPLPTGEILRGPAALATWSGLLALGLLGTYAAWRRSAAATWLLLLAALGLAATLGACGLFGRPPWGAFLAALGRPADLGPASPLLPLLVGLSPALLLLVLAMARRAFLSPPPA